jgi:hypothetical protein
MFSSSKNDQNQTKKLVKIPSNPIKTQIQNNLIDSTKKEVENQFTTIEEIPSNEYMINVPQGSIASDIQQSEDLNDNDGNSDIEQQPIINDINNLNLDEVSRVLHWVEF